MEEEMWEIEDVRLDYQTTDGQMKEFGDAVMGDHAKSDDDEAEIVSPFLCPKNSDALISVLNKLNRYSFLKFSKTCRYLNDICWNSKGINIPFDCAVDVGDIGVGCQVWTGEKDHLYHQRHRNNLSDAQLERILTAKQFRVQVELIHVLNELNEASLARTDMFLAKIGCEVTEKLWINALGLDISPKQLIQFAKQLRVKEFRCDNDLPGDTLSYFLENMHSFHYDGPVPANFFLGIRVPPRLHLMGVQNTYSFDTFMEILEGWGKGDSEIDEWNLGRNFHPEDDPDYFDKFLDRFTWIRIPQLFDRRLQSTRPLLLLMPEKFPRYLLRSDGQILGFFYSIYGIRGLFLRKMKFSQMRKKIPILFPTIGEVKDDDEMMVID